MMARSRKLQIEAGYIDARPLSTISKIPPATHGRTIQSGQSQTIEGNVCITASEAFAAFVLPAIVAKLRREHPGITVEILASNALSDLRRREADIAIRNAAPSDPDLIAKKLHDEPALLYASEAYLQRLSDLKVREELARAEFIGFEDNDQYLAGLKGKGLELTPSHFPIVTASHLVHWQLVKQGLGIGVMATRIGDAEPLVRRAAPWLEPFTVPMWLVAHRELRTSQRVRLVFDFIARELVEGR